MCLEDIRIGRRSHTVRHTVAIAAFNAQILPANPHRVAVIFRSHNIGNQTFDNVTVASIANGFFIATNGNTIALNIRDHGDIVVKPWHVMTSIAGMTVVFYEVIFDHDTQYALPRGSDEEF